MYRIYCQEDLVFESIDTKEYKRVRDIILNSSWSHKVYLK